jgi:hypothetical protein
MARAALGRSLLAAGGTLFVIAGGTMALSTVSMAVTKIVADRSKVLMVLRSIKFTTV